MTIYRATRHRPDPHEILQRKDTPRAPRNVPYFVDNIWEWLRPEDMPSRRHSVYASPTPEAARESISHGAPENPVHISRIQADNRSRYAQLNIPDARNHADVGRLPRIFLKALGEAWLASPATERAWAASLFLPCASKTDVNDALSGPEADELAAALRQESTFWSSIRMRSFVGPCDPIGEIFFEPCHSGYRLVPCDY